MRLTIYSTLEVEWGGSEMLWYNIAKTALEQKHTVQVCITKSSSENFRIKILEAAGVQIIRREYKYYFRYKIIRRLITLKFLKEIKKFHPQVVLISQGGCFEFLYNYSLFALIEELNAPFFLISQFNFENGNILNEKFRQELEVFKNKWKKFYFVSERNLLTAERQSAMKFINTEIISNSLNIRHLTKAKWCNDTTLKLCCIARYDCSYKGQDILLQALSAHEFKQYNYHLNFYGEGPDKNYLLALIKLYGLENSVSINGHIADIDKIWEEHHALLLPSIHEGMPLVLQECMLKGRAALVTDVGGCSTLIDEGKTGFLAAAASVNSLSVKLTSLFDVSLDRLQAMGDAAHLKALRLINATIHHQILSDLQAAVN